MARYRTNKDIHTHAFCLTASGRHMGDGWTLPKGSMVMVVKGAEGGRIDKFAAASVDQIKRLSGNTHDPVYRYMFIDDADVEEF